MEIPSSLALFTLSNVTVQGKHTVVLPCWLSPTQSAEAMEVNWFYQDQFDAPVMLYKDKTLNSVSQPASYTGRVSFGQKEASSGGLTDGDVSLKLVNVTLADAGKYTCYVSSEKHHDKASLNLILFIFSTANVQLVNSDNKFITIKNNILRDNVDFPAGDKVTCLTAVTGTPGFSSGKHYWEVSLVINGAAAVPPKQSWWIGVTNKSVIPKDYKHSSIADNGFWFLSSSPDNAGVLQFSSNPPTCFYVSALPRKIGVFLDYDGGTLQFYNAENRRRLGFFPTKFSGEVFPLFNPGTGDRAPMEIISRTKLQRYKGVLKTDSRHQST
uniref:Uncharacterized protein n=1 Tax=Neogobius melanostomus TaxID=47308 RepID=A0A8C6U3Z2_9GOBI